AWGGVAVTAKRAGSAARPGRSLGPGAGLPTGGGVRHRRFYHRPGGGGSLAAAGAGAGLSAGYRAGFGGEAHRSAGAADRGDGGRLATVFHWAGAGRDRDRLPHPAGFGG